MHICRYSHTILYTRKRNVLQTMRTVREREKPSVKWKRQKKLRRVSVSTTTQLGLLPTAIRSFSRHTRNYCSSRVPRHGRAFSQWTVGCESIVQANCTHTHTHTYREEKRHIHTLPTITKTNTYSYTAPATNSIRSVHFGISSVHTKECNILISYAYSLRNGHGFLFQMWKLNAERT